MVPRPARCLLTLSFGLFAWIPPASAAEAPNLTIEQVIQEGDRYQGQMVRIRGQSDNCYGECALCPEGTTTDNFRRATCLSLVIGEAQLSSTVHDLMKTMYRFAVVTIEARFTSGCIYGPGGRILYAGPRSAAVYNESTGKQHIVCFNHLRPSDLSEARIIQVHARKTVFNGLIDPQWIWDELVPADSGERDAVLAEWDRAAGTAYPEVFTVKDKERQADIALTTMMVLPASVWRPLALGAGRHISCSA